MLVHEMIVFAVWINLFVGSLVAVIFLHLRCKRHYSYHLLKLSTLLFFSVFVFVGGENYFIPVSRSREMLVYELFSNGVITDIWSIGFVIAIDLIIFVGLCTFFAKRTSVLIGIGAEIALWILITQLRVVVTAFWNPLTAF